MTFYPAPPPQRLPGHGRAPGHPFTMASLRAVAACALLVIAGMNLGPSTDRSRLDLLIAASIVMALLGLADLVAGGAGAQDRDPSWAPPRRGGAARGAGPACRLCGAPLTRGTGPPSGPHPGPSPGPPAARKLMRDADGLPSVRDHSYRWLDDPAAADLPGSHAAQARMAADPELQAARGPAAFGMGTEPAAYLASLSKVMADRMGALFLLVALGPLMLAACCALAADGRGRVLLRQTKRDWSGRRFVVHDFRDGSAGIADSPGRAPSPVEDFLRLSRLAALPRLIAVLSGRLSLVGPVSADPQGSAGDGGPGSARERAATEIIAHLAGRTRVRPGFTGWSQIHAPWGPDAAGLPTRQRVALDLDYLETATLGFDLRILCHAARQLVHEESEP